jgi:hypothetical protein
VDNASGLLPIFNNAPVRESVAGYVAAYGSLLNVIGQAVQPRWLLANSAGGGTTADTVVQHIQGYFEEFMLRPLAQTYTQFEGLAAQVARRAALKAPAPYAVFDSSYQGGSPTDPRTQLATLAAYYLLQDPATTFLDPFGGSEPATSWTRHWIPAAAYDVGQPAGGWSLFATGPDPANTALTYRVYQRTYGNALVLYKPLSSGNSVPGGLADATATVHALGGSYALLQADGTLGPVVTSVTLRNGEGAILIKVRSAAAPMAVEAGPVAAPPSPGDAPGTPDSRFVAAVYRNLLGRDASEAELSGWSGLLTQGVTHSQVAQAVAGSPEYLGREVDGLYRLLLQRDADADGRAFFVGLLQRGGTIEQVTAALAGSDEYLRQRGGGTADGFLDAAYHDLLGRDADADGRTFFGQALASGALDRGQVAALLAGSDAARALRVQRLYQEALGRAADPSGLDFFTAALGGRMRDTDVLALLVGSDEFLRGL